MIEITPYDDLLFDQSELARLQAHKIHLLSRGLWDLAVEIGRTDTRRISDQYKLLKKKAAWLGSVSETLKESSERLHWMHGVLLDKALYASLKRR